MTHNMRSRASDLRPTSPAPVAAIIMRFRYRGHDLEIRPLAHLASGWIDGKLAVCDPNAASVVKRLLAELSQPNCLRVPDLTVTSL